MTFEQKLCAAYVAFFVFLFGDVLARGNTSFFGRFFLWLVSVLA